MKLPMKVWCDVCGGEARGTPRTSAAMWDPKTIVYHSDPRECRRVLRDRRKDEERSRRTPVDASMMP